MADGDLLALLHGAADRTTTLTGDLRSWWHASRSSRAFERARVFASGPIGTMVHHVGGPGEVPDEGEMVWRVVHASGGRYRWDPVSQVGPYRGHAPPGRQGSDGQRTWNVGDHTVFIGPRHGSMLGQRLLDPAWALTHDLEIVGDAESSGRSVLRVHAVARPDWPRSGGAAEMAAERDLLVDAERGFLHGDTALVDGEPYDEVSLRSVVLDAPVDPSMFDPDIPAGFEVFDHSTDPPPPLPWERRTRWHFQWPITRW
ncbi:MAG TPA: hypothetical protein VNY84_11765 [Acidimicrobiales bacterium]|nr:hypothetical protein [Acidimicrobiales bacterium]